MNKILAIVVFALAAFGAHGQVKYIEDAVESAYVELLLGDNGRGKVHIPECDVCPSLYIDENTRAYLDGKPITLQEARQRARKGATVIYDLETKAITRIIM
ncbi:MAG: hypothetical protein AB7U81_12115 [Thiohalomonadaceae bacterium]